VKKFFKSIHKDPALREKYVNAIQFLLSHPYAGELKKGDLAGIYGFDIRHNGIYYELAYSISEDENRLVVILIHAGTREQFYKELKRYIKTVHYPKK